MKAALNSLAKQSQAQLGKNSGVSHRFNYIPKALHYLTRILNAYNGYPKRHYLWYKHKKTSKAKLSIFT